jgi:hypothetical protein
MGSQNVTNFAKVHMLRARKALKPYAAEEPTAEQAWTAITTAVGPLTKSHPFVKAVSSKGYETTLDLLLSFYDKLRKAKHPKQLEEVLRNHNVDPKVQKPLLRLTSQMTKMLSDRLTSQQEESDAGSAAKDAVTKTLMDVLSQSMPADKVESASPQQLSKAFQRIERDALAELFFKNALSSLTMLYLDAAKVPRPIQEKVIPAILDESGLPAALSREVVKLAPNRPEKIRSKVDKRSERAGDRKPVFEPEFEPERRKRPKT